MRIKACVFIVAAMLVGCSTSESGGGDAGTADVPVDLTGSDGSEGDQSVEPDTLLDTGSDTLELPEDGGTNAEVTDAVDATEEDTPDLEVEGDATPEELVEPEDAQTDTGPSDDGAGMDAGSPPMGAEDWVNLFGGAGNEEVKAVAADSFGNVYVAGVYQNSFSVGGLVFDAVKPGEKDAFVASFEPTGAFRWAHAFGAAGADIPFEIMVDGKDDVYVAGSHHEDLMIGNELLSSKGSTDIFVVSYDMYGGQLWAKNWGGPAGESPRSLYVNAQGDVFITGSFNGYMEADAIEVGDLQAFGLSEIFVLAVDGQTHDAMWLQTFKGAGHDVGTAIVADPKRNVVVAISFQQDLNVTDAITFDSGGLNFNVGLIRLDKTGEVEWANHYGGTGVSEIWGLDMDPEGNTYLTGIFTETGDFGGPPLVAVAGHEVMLAKHDAQGAHLWSKAFTGNGTDQALDLEVSADGVYVAGRFREELDFEGQVLNASPGNYDMFVGHFATSDGAPIWVAAVGSEADDQANGVCVGGDGSIFVGGYVKGPLMFAGENKALANGGGLDAFVFRFDQ